MLCGGDVDRLQGAQLTAAEVVLRTRMETVRMALVEIDLATDEDGYGLSDQRALLLGQIPRICVD